MKRLHKVLSQKQLLHYDYVSQAIFKQLGHRGNAVVLSRRKLTTQWHALVFWQQSTISRLMWPIAGLPCSVIGEVETLICL